MHQKRVLFICLVSLFVLISCQTPGVPTTWPAVWHTWVVTTVQQSSNPPTFLQGQLVMFDTVSQVACRYWEQNLINQSLARPADYCDYNANSHYIMNDTKPNSECAGILKLEGKLTPLVYPPDFVNNARFLGVDKVAQLDCNHFFAPQVKLSDGSFVQLDVWTDVNRGLPCQISALSQTTRFITTWAFDGFDRAIPHQAIVQCSIPKILCSQENWVCHAKPSINPNALQSALSWTCGEGKVDCSPINPGGSHFYPDTLIDHCNWAFTEYFMQHRHTQGIDACNFNGVAELVPPPPTPPPPTSDVRGNEISVLDFLGRFASAKAQGPDLSVYPYDLVCTLF